MRGVGDKELTNIANRLERAILARGPDFTPPRLLPLIRSGVIYTSYQPSRNQVPRLAERIASIARQLEPKHWLLIVIEHEYVEVYN